MFPKPAYKNRGIIERQLDDVISLIVRIAAKWICIKCRRRYPPIISRRTGLPAQNLMTCSHFYNKWKASTRWDLDNLDALCLFCHGEIEQHKKEDVGGFNYDLYMYNKLGERAFDALRTKSEIIRKYSTSELEDMLSSYQSELNLLLGKTAY